jgi:hypothetical protein
MRVTRLRILESPNVCRRSPTSIDAAAQAVAQA